MASGPSGKPKQRAKRPLRDVHPTDEGAPLHDLFPHRPSYRETSISDPCEGTFEWIFEPKPRIESSFPQWLENGQGIFWITGKAGSGKSTLMKFICHHARTLELLQTWSDPKRCVIARFFFWKPATTSQKSQVGLLKSLLHQIVEQVPELLAVAFPSRTGPGLQQDATSDNEFPLEDLIQAFQRIANYDKVPARFCLFIDGLDEAEEDPLELIALLNRDLSSSIIKICVSSRPWNVFMDFQKEGLQLHNHTRDDISLYVESTLRGSLSAEKLRTREPDAFQNLSQEILDQSSGVFLWVHLAVRSLLNGLVDGDRMSDLRRRLHELPPEIEELYTRLLHSIDEFYLEHASQYLRVAATASGSLPLLLYWLIDENLVDETAPTERTLEAYHLIHSENIEGIQETMSRRLASRCRGLLEVHVDPSQAGLFSLKVTFLHRTVREFLLFTPVISKTRGYLKSGLAAERATLKAYIRLIGLVPFSLQGQAASTTLADIFRNVIHYVDSENDDRHSLGNIRLLVAFQKTASNAAISSVQDENWLSLFEAALSTLTNHGRMDRDATLRELLPTLSVWATKKDHNTTSDIGAESHEISRATRYLGGKLDEEIRDDEPPIVGAAETALHSKDNLRPHTRFDGAERLPDTEEGAIRGIAEMTEEEDKLQGADSSDGASSHRLVASSTAAPTEDNTGHVTPMNSIPSLPLLIDQVFEAVFPATEPPIPEGKVRVRWTCRCGRKLFDDFQELVPGSLEELESKLRAETKVIPGATMVKRVGKSFLSAINFLAALPFARPWRLRPSVAPSIIPMHAVAAHGAPAVQTPAVGDSFFLLLCIDNGVFHTKLHQKHIGKYETDRALFCFLQAEYYNCRKLKTWFTLRSVNSLSLSRFAVDLSTFAEIHEHIHACPPACVCLPPEERVDVEYRCNPAPKTRPKYVPAIGPRRLTHYLRHPECIDISQKTIYDQLPKRFGGELVASSSQEELGWGVHFQEGWHWRTIYVILVVFLLSFSLIFGIVWSVTRADVQGAFAISSFWLTLGSVLLGYLAVRSQ